MREKTQSHRATFPALAATVIACCLALHARAGERVRIIFDTDMDSDCDDAAALALLHALADNGEAEILATLCSATHPFSASCTDAINTYYGRPDLPIGVPKAPPAHKPRSRYAEQIAREFPNDVPRGDATPDAAKLYRQLLAAQPDKAVVIVTVGDVTNLRTLLESPPDALSPLPGRDLAARKVKHWVCMGSRYPADLDPGRWGNFKPDPESTVRAVAGWPTLITFTGGGEFAESLATGRRLAELPKSNPVRRVYELYFGGEVKNRHSADPIAVLVAVRGTGAPWKLVTEGHNHIFPNGTHEWRREPNNPLHQYIAALAEGVEARTVAAEMEALMVQPPRLRGAADAR